MNNGHGDPDLEAIRDAGTPLPETDPEPEPRPRRAWEPVTPTGVAAFAQARLGRLLLIELGVALVVAAAVLWFVRTAWLPVVRAAIEHLPPQGAIQNQRLLSPHTSLEPLASSRFLGFGIDLERRGSADVGADLYFKFHRQDFYVCSLLGYMVLQYPPGWTIEFNRTELAPWWGAWEPLLLGSLLFLVPALLLLVWSALATVYAPILRLIGHAQGQTFGWGAAWRLSSAVLMPGALLVAGAIFLYGLGLISLIRFLLVVALHLVVGWVYLVICPRHLPARVDAPSGNPFSPDNPALSPKKKRKNIFRPD